MKKLLIVISLLICSSSFAQYLTPQMFQILDERYGFIGGEIDGTRIAVGSTPADRILGVALTKLTFFGSSGNVTGTWDMLSYTETDPVYLAEKDSLPSFLAPFMAGSNMTYRSDGHLDVNLDKYDYLLYQLTNNADWIDFEAGNIRQATWEEMESGGIAAVDWGDLE